MPRNCTVPKKSPTNSPKTWDIYPFLEMFSRPYFAILDPKAQI